MLKETHQHLTYFINKVCTIVTSPINRSFSEDIMRQYFVGVVRHITVDGVIAQHVSEPLMSYFPWPHIVSIQEEKVLTQAEYDKKLVEEITTPEPVVDSGVPFVDIKNIRKVVKDISKG